MEVTPGPVWHSLYRWIISQADEFLAFQTVYLITDNRDLLAATVSSTAGLSHWPMVAAWWKERIRYVGPYGERTTVVCVPISADTGLSKVHPTWAGTYILDACVFLFQTSTLHSLIVTVCQLHYSRSRSCGFHALKLIPLQMKADSQQPSRVVQLLLHRKEQDQLTRVKPRNNNRAPLSSCPSREASRT